MIGAPARRAGASTRISQSSPEISTSTPIPRTSPARAVVIGCLGILIAYLPVVGVPVILGDIAADTGASTSELQWITASGLLALAAAVLSAGVAADILGRKALIMAGFGLMAIGGLVGILAGIPSGSAGIVWLYVGQVFIGLGGGALLTATLTVISEAATSQHQRTFFISLWASSLVIGSGAGPFISGFTAAFATWNWIFLPLVVLALVMIPATALALAPSKRVPGRSFDVWGQVTAVIAVTALVFSIIQGPSAGWASAQSLISFAVAAVFIVAFVLVERSSKAPLVRLDLFHSAAFVVAGVASMVILFAIVGIAFVLTLFLNGTQDVTVLDIATRVGFLYLFAAITGPVVGSLQHKVGTKVLLVLGLLVAAVGVGALAITPDHANLLALAWPLSITGIGVGAVLSTVSSVAIHAAPLPLAGMAGATNTLFRQIGAALGPAIGGTVLTTSLASGNDFTAAMHSSMTVIAVALLCTSLLGALVLFRRAPKA